MPETDWITLFAARLLELLGSSETPSELASAAARVLVNLKVEWCCIWLMHGSGSDGDLDLAGVQHREEGKRGLLDRLVRGWPTKTDGAIWREVIDQQQPFDFQVRESLQVREVFGSEDRGRIAKDLGTNSFTVAALVHRREVLGMFAVAPAGAEDRIITDAARLLTTALFSIQQVATARASNLQHTPSAHRLQTILDSRAQGVIVASCAGRADSISQPVSDPAAGQGYRSRSAPGRDSRDY